MFKATTHQSKRPPANAPRHRAAAWFISLLLVSILLAPVMARPRLGLASYTCRNFNFEQMVDFAVEQGIREVQVYEAHLDPEAPAEVNAAKKAYLEKKGVRAYSGYYALGPDMARNRRAFELARMFDMDFIVVEPKDLALWDEIEKLVKEFDLRVAIHNHGRGTAYGDPATVRKVLAERDARVGVCLDVGWAASAGYDVAEVFREYGDRVWDVHFKDKTESKLVDGRFSAEDLPIGQGRANLEGLAEQMKQTGWAGVLALESDSKEVAKAPAEFVDNGRKFFRHHFISHAFRAAAVKKDITPATPRPLRGYSIPRISTGVHDRIYHRIVVMDDGEEEFVLISSDLCNLPAVKSDHFANWIARRLGIPRTNVWWCVTHTHSAPYYGMRPLETPPEGEKWDSAYDAPVEQAVMDGVLEAHRRLAPAKLGVGWGEARAIINRRARNPDGSTSLGMNPEGPVDRRIGLLRLDDASNGKPIALIANYAMHGTVLGSANTLITGDAPGYVSETVEQELGAPMLYINGAAGNLAPLYSVPSATSSLHHLPRFKVLLADKIVEASRRITSTTPAVRFRPWRIHVDTPTNGRRPWPRRLNEYRLSDEAPPRVAIPVRTLRINDDILIWALPMELFCEISNEVRDRSPVPYTFYFGYTGGGLGYMPSPGEFPFGGYEVSKTFFTPETPARLIDAVLGIANQKTRP